MAQTEHHTAQNRRYRHTHRVPGTITSLQIMLWAMLSTFLAGCAGWSGHGIAPTVETGRLRIAVLPVEVTAQVHRLADIATLPDNVPDDETERIAAELARAGIRMGDRLNAALSHQPDFDLADRQRVALSLSTQPAVAPSADDAQAAAVGRALGVPMVLRTRLSGYGKLKHRWTVYLIGSGVAEGVVQGLIAARITNNTWLAVGLAVEEIAQEALTWGGGAYLFNRHYTPVTLESRLIASDDGAVLWHDTVFVGTNRKALKQLPEAQREQRQVQLQLTADKAGNRLARHLTKAIRKHTK